MLTIKRNLSFICAAFLLLAAILGCGRIAKQPDWVKSRKIAGKEQGLSHISGLVSDDMFAYVTIGGNLADEQEGHSGLRKVALDSGAVTSLDNGEKTPQSDYGGLAIDDKFIYWNAGGNILRISKEGGKPEVVAADHVGIGVDLVVDNEKVYWANHGYYSANSPTRPSPIYVVAKQGGKVETFSADQHIPHSLVVDEKFVYWETPSSIVKQAKAGGPAQVIYQASNEEGVDELAQDADYLYFGFRAAGDSRWALRRISKQGGEPQTIVKRYSLKPVVTDETFIYFFDEDGLTTDLICRVPNNGGEVEKLDSGYASGVITQGKTQIYFASLDDIHSWKK
ncbi:MAG TPA: hypothetical protein VGO56_22215 [Pyrinomonadaceae bacterium]|nr:hypothetical protein [Pyrinomonadaceae bacterium]